MLFGYSKYIILNLKSDDIVHEIDILSTLLHDCDYDNLINENAFDKIDCYYSTDKNQWKYNFMGDFVDYSAKIKKTEQTQCFEIYKEEKYEAHKLECLTQALPKRYWNDVVIKRLHNLFDIDFMEHLTNEWYSIMLHCKLYDLDYMNEERFFVVAAKIKKNVIPKDFIESFEENEFEPVYDDKTNTYIVFILNVSDEKY